MVYTVKSLAEKWKCSKQMILKMLNQGKLRGFKIGVEWRISEKEVQKYEVGRT